MGKRPWSSSEKAATERSLRFIGFRAPLTSLLLFLGVSAGVSDSALSLSDTRRVCCDFFRFRTWSVAVGLFRSLVTLCPNPLLTGGAEFGRWKFRNEVFFAFEELCTISFLMEFGAGGIGLDPFLCIRLKKLMLKRQQTRQQ